MFKQNTVIFAICLCSVGAYIEIELPRKAFDTEMYENVLDEELCEAQLSYLLNNNTMLAAQFLDAGIRVPKGILQGNFVDLGNYHQCLGISANFEPTDIEGKYCMISVPLVQDEIQLPEWPDWNESLPEFPWPELLPNTRSHNNIMRNLENIRRETAWFSRLTRPDVDLMRVSDDSEMADMNFNLAVCLPKACTTKKFIDTLFINTTAVGFQLTEDFCRLKNDKPFSPGDYAAIAIFGFILLITLISTSYDLYYNVICKGNPKGASVIGKSFSLYTNTRRLLTFNSGPGALESLDGIRSFAMMWVILGHTYSTLSNGHFMNRLDMFTWMFTLSAVWVTAAPITVDTFFLLSGLLVVYTTVGKISPRGLLKNLHLFYLNRLLRMFPILASGVFLQATLFNHFSDGPNWYIVAEKVERCRTYWWSTLIYLQNYLTDSWCIGPSWYLAIDVQLHILSPLILFWVLSKGRSAWIALTLAMLVVMVASTTYNYMNGFQVASFVPTRSDSMKYTRYYYVNTLTRCSPFFVGMLFGYVLNIFKGKEVHLAKWFVALCWTCAVAVISGIIYSTYPVLQMDWDSPFWDGIFNSFARPGWATCVGWMIFACTHGYGGPINWVLSLRMWKLPARLSFAMYIFHYPMMFIVNTSSASVTYFSVERFLFKFLAHFATAFLVAFVVTVAIDSPCSTLIKLVLGGSKPEKVDTKEDKGEKL